MPTEDRPQPAEPEPCFICNCFNHPEHGLLFCDKHSGGIKATVIDVDVLADLRVKLSEAEAKLAQAKKRFVGGGDLVADIDDLLLSEYNLRAIVDTLMEALRDIRDGWDCSCYCVTPPCRSCRAEAALQKAREAGAEAARRRKGAK